MARKRLDRRQMRAWQAYNRQTLYASTHPAALDPMEMIGPRNAEMFRRTDVATYGYGMQEES